MRRNYEEEVIKLSKAIDIAIEAAEKYMPEQDEKTQEYFIKAYRIFKEEILNPKPQYKNLKSLGYNITEVFTYFQEAKGDAVEYFWKRLKEENIDYKRVNKLDKILKRGRIKNEEEYDFLTDTIVPLETDGVINKEEAKKLGYMLHDYEFGTK